MQTICAEVLGMERGVSSEKKHLEASRYKAQARQKELEALQKERDEVVAKREETERMTETLREESKDLQLRKQTLEEDIENSVRIAHRPRPHQSTVKRYSGPNPKEFIKISGKNKSHAFQKQNSIIILWP